MAKITITIEDQPLDMVKIESTQSFETMALMINSGHKDKMTAAHGYAAAMLNKAREVSKDGNPLAITLPKVNGLSL